MKASRTVATVLALLFVVSVLAVSVQAAPGIQKTKKQPTKAAAKGTMPKEVAALIQEGLATRQGRQDIPFAFFKQLILPAKEGQLYPVYFIKARNGDLGYAPSASGTSELETTLIIYYQFYQPAADGTLKAGLGGKSEPGLKTPAEGYSADAEDFYSFGLGKLGLRLGKYTLALVLSTPDMSKLSVAYSDIDLTGSEAQQSGFWLTDPVIVKSAEQVDPDPQPTLRRGYFTWGGLKVVPNAAGEIAVAEVLDTLFFAVGANPKQAADQAPMNELEVTFEVQAEDGRPLIKWAPTTYDIYFVNIPLPLENTVEIESVDEKGAMTKRTEKKPLSAGKYALAVSVTDKVSGKKADTKMAFAIK